MPMPRAAAACGSWMRRSTPCVRVSPASGSTSPMRIFIRVDLPAPFCPSTPWISPGKRDRLTRSQATTPPNLFVMSTSSTRGAEEVIASAPRSSVRDARSGSEVVGLLLDREQRVLELAGGDVAVDLVHRLLLVRRRLADHCARLLLESYVERVDGAFVELTRQQLGEQCAEVVTGIELDRDLVLDVGARAGVARPRAHGDDVVLVGQLHHGFVGAAQIRIDRSDTLALGRVVGLGRLLDVVEAPRGV